MHIPADFRRQIIATFEQRGADWLDQLPDLIESYARRWSLSVGPAFPGLSFNYVAPTTRADGSPAVLKLGVPREELCTEIDALRLYLVVPGRRQRLLGVLPDLCQPAPTTLRAL